MLRQQTLCWAGWSAEAAADAAGCVLLLLLLQLQGHTRFHA